MKKFAKFLLLVLLIPCCFLFTACEGKVYVKEIKKTGTSGKMDTYTIYYSNGKTSNFVIENGKDGTDLSFEEVYQAWLTRNNYDDTDEKFDQFLSNYFTMNIDTAPMLQSTTKAMKSAVSVYCNTGSTLGISAGAGFVYKMETTNSYIVTNYHVVYDASSASKVFNQIYIYQYGSNFEYEEKNLSSRSYVQFGGDGISATYVGGSESYDIAVLKVPTASLKSVNPSVREVDIANGYSVNENVFAIGNPEGEGISVTSGVVSKDDFDYVSLRISSYHTYRELRTDTAVNEGNSGGGLFNAQGELVGVINAKPTDTSLEGIGYALPYDNITKVADNIIANYKSKGKAVGVKKFTIGITIDSKNPHAVYGLENFPIEEDVFIESVEANSLASTKSKMQPGLIIKKIIINDKEYEITRFFQPSEVLLDVRVGDTVTFVLYDENTKLTENVVFTNASTFKSIE